MNEIDSLMIDETEILEDNCLNSEWIEKVTDNDLLNNALHYAKLGYPVVPLHYVIRNGDFVRCSCKGWQECEKDEKQGKHPKTRFGHKQATTDEWQIRAWWAKYPKANIGLLTGRETGIFVLDIDLRHFGHYSLEYLQDYYRDVLGSKYQPMPETLTTITGSGGRHYYFKHPMGVKIKSSSSLIGLGLDIKGEGSYIIAPPSVHFSGNGYSWVGVNSSIEEAPNWLIYEILNAEKGQSITPVSPSHLRSESFKYNKRVLEGNRNNVMKSYVCGLVNSYSKEEVLSRAIQQSNEYFEPPLGEKRIESIVNWAWREFRDSIMKMRSNF